MFELAFLAVRAEKRRRSEVFVVVFAPLRSLREKP